MYVEGRKSIVKDCNREWAFTPKFPWNRKPWERRKKYIKNLFSYLELWWSGAFQLNMSSSRIHKISKCRVEKSMSIWNPCYLKWLTDALVKVSWIEMQSSSVNDVIVKCESVLIDTSGAINTAFQCIVPIYKSYVVVKDFSFINIDRCN